LENAGVVDVRLGDPAVNLRPRQGPAILIKKDVEVIGWARSIGICARRVDFRDIPNLTYRNDEIVSGKIAKRGSIRSFLRTRGGRPGAVQLIIKDHGG
jgi:hypothetical protein